MKKIIIASIAAIMLSSPIIANAGNACKGITFGVKNVSGTSIKLVSVKFRNITVGRTQSELFPTLTCPNNNVCRTTIGQNLSNARNSQLDDFVFRFKFLDLSTGKWSSKRLSNTFKVNNATCIANRRYGGGHWSITPNYLTSIAPIRL